MFIKLMLTALVGITTVNNNQEFGYPTPSYVDNQGVIYIVEDGEATIYAAKKTSETIDIPETITYYGKNYEILSADVTSVSSGAFDGNKTLKNITGMNNIEHIGVGAFKGSVIEGINGEFEINLENLKTIDEEAFYKNKSIKVVNAPKLESVGTKAFYDADALIGINDKNKLIIDFEIADYTFMNCDLISEVEYDLSVLPKGSFKNTTSLNNFIAKNLNHLEEESFENSSINLLKADLNFVGKEAFKDSGIKTVGEHDSIIDLGNVLVVNENILENTKVNEVQFNYVKEFKTNALNGLDAKKVEIINYVNTFKDALLDLDTLIVTKSDVYNKLNYKTEDYKGVYIKHNDLSKYFDIFFTDIDTDIKMFVYPNFSLTIDYDKTQVKNAKIKKTDNYFTFENVTGDIEIYFRVLRDNQIIHLENVDGDLVDPITNFKFEKYFNSDFGIDEFMLVDAKNLEKNLFLSSFVSYNNEVYSLSRIKNGSFNPSQPIKKVIANSIVRVDGETFKNLSSLEEVYMSDLSFIGKEAFYNTSLVGFNEENYFDLKNVKVIGESSFYNTKETSLVLGDGVVILESAFASNENLKEVNTNGALIKSASENSFFTNSKHDRYLYINSMNDIDLYDVLDGKTDGFLYDLELVPKYGNITLIDSSKGTYEIVTDLYDPLGIYIRVIPKEGYTYDKETISINNSTRPVKHIEDDLFLIYAFKANMNLNINFTEETKLDSFS